MNKYQVKFRDLKNHKTAFFQIKVRYKLLNSSSKLRKPSIPPFKKLNLFFWCSLASVLMLVTRVGHW